MIVLFLYLRYNGYAQISRVARLFAQREYMTRLIRRSIYSLILLTLSFTACQPQTSLTSSNPTGKPTWLYSTLRALDAADAEQPSGDLIALYTRAEGSEFQIRLDLLDFSVPVDHDIYIAFDYQPGGTNKLPLGQPADIAWDLLLYIPSDGAIIIQDDENSPVQGIKLSTLRDPFMDTVEISIQTPGNFLALGLSTLQIYTTRAGLTGVTDAIGPVSTRESTPQPARVVFGFWHTFQSTTSAQILRSWDGAHSGPSSSRHGLNNLLTALDTYHVPTLLFDLKTPANLSALDYLGVLGDVQKLSNRGLIVMPDVHPIGINGQIDASSAPLNWNTEWATSRLIASDTQLLSQFNFANSRLSYSPTPLQNPPGQYELFFNGILTSQQSIYTVELLGWRNHSDIVYIDNGYAQDNLSTETDEPNYQASPTGPSIDLRRALLAAAMDASKPIILLGGDFPKTNWGNPSSALNTLHYLVNHPWIQFMTTDDLLLEDPQEHYNRHASSSTSSVPLNTTLGQAISTGLDSQQMQCKVIDALHSAPNNTFTNLAWQMYHSLNSTPATEDSHALNAQYLGQIGHILAAAEWAEAPRSRNDCETDIDWDGQTECILASISIFTTFESEGGYLAYAFAMQDNELHQLIAPSYQLATGLSDPSLWDAQYGLLADPSQVLGACADSIHNWQEYQTSGEPGAVRMISSDLLTTKLFELLPDSIRITIHSSPDIDKQTIPLILDPWMRFTPGWGNIYQVKDTAWMVENGPAITINTSADFNIHPFSTLSSFANTPEDPNFNFPPGHFLPIPMALIEVSHQQSPLVIEISIIP